MPRNSWPRVAIMDNLQQEHALMPCTSRISLQQWWPSTTLREEVCIPYYNVACEEVSIMISFPISKVPDVLIAAGRRNYSQYQFECNISPRYETIVSSNCPPQKNTTKKIKHLHIMLPAASALATTSRCCFLVSPDCVSSLSGLEQSLWKVPAASFHASH